MNRILILILIFNLGACTIMSVKTNYGMVTTKTLTPGEKLKLDPKKIEESKCLYFILSLIPVGSFSLNQLTERVDNILDEEKARALGNIEFEQNFSVFFPFYMKTCSNITASPLR